MSNRILTAIAVVCFFAIFGISFAKVASIDLWVGAIGGALISAIALCITFLFKKRTALIETESSRAELVCMRFMTSGFFLAMFGWMVAVFHPSKIGYGLMVLGILSAGVCIVILKIIAFTK